MSSLYMSFCPDNLTEISFRSIDLYATVTLIFEFAFTFQNNNNNNNN